MQTKEKKRKMNWDTAWLYSEKIFRSIKVIENEGNAKPRLRHRGDR